MSSPSITASIEPEENGKLVYLAVAPNAADQRAVNMLAFRLQLHNSGPTSERLTQIAVLLQPLSGQPGNLPPQLFTFDRDIAIAPGATQTTYLAAEESIPFVGSPPNLVQIRLLFAGHDDPIVLVRQPAIHRSPTPQQSYRFPAHTDDMAFDAYFTQKARHSGGSQHFAYDIGVRRWDVEQQEFTWLTPGTSGSQNEHNLAWGKPLYAMADGTVIGFANDEADNPAPGRRALVRLGQQEAGEISLLSIARLSNQRLVTAVRTDAGRLRLNVWQTSPDGEQLDALGQHDGEAITRVATVRLSATQLVTAVRTPTARFIVGIWSVSEDGQTITPLGEDDAGAVERFAVTRLSTTRFAAATRAVDGTLRVLVWNVSNNGLTVTLANSTSAGVIKDVDVVALSDTRLLVAVQTADDRLKLIVWDIVGGGTLTRRGDATGASCLDVALAKIHQSQQRVATAVRSADNTLTVVIWEIDEAGEVTSRAEGEGGEVAAVAAARINDDSMLATCLITGAGTLKIIVWEYEVDDGTPRLSRLAENEGGVTDRIAIASLKVDENPLLLANAVRTVDGQLKVIIWRLVAGGGNHFFLLHGNELVLYAHMIKGSLNPALCQIGAAVARGQFLGQLGNSGSSSGPHLHIDTKRVPPGLSIQQMIQLHQQRQLADSAVYRPLPFHNAQAMQLSEVSGGILADNPFAVVNDRGFYWERMAIWPGLTTPGIPTGRAEIAFHGVRGSDYQRLFDKVTGANYRPVWVDGYAIGNELRFNVLFRPADGSDWSAHHNLNGEEYQQVVDEQRAQGKRLAYVNSYLLGNRVLYAAIFREVDGVDRSAYHGLSVEAHQSEFDRLTAQGFAPVNVSVVSINGQRAYAALYERRNVGGVLLRSFLTPTQFQDEFNAHKDDSLQLAYLDAYEHEGGVRFSAIWNGAHAGTIHARHHLTSAAYLQEYEATTDQGFLTISVAGYTLQNQQQFVGVWRR